MHRGLVDGFFRNARGMLQAGGEIHVNHKTTAPFCQWNIAELASQYSLILAECVDFKIEDYPGYKNKRGDGSRCDEPFPLGECSTFKFRLSCKTKRSLRDIGHFAPAIHERSQQFPGTLTQMQQRSTSNDFNYPRAGQFTDMGHVSEDLHLPFTIGRMPHLALAEHGRSQQFLETPTQMQQRSTSNGFYYSRAGQFTDMGHVSEDVRLPFTVGRIPHLAPAAHRRSQQFPETLTQMQQHSTSNDFNYPRAGQFTDMGHVSEDVRLPFTVGRIPHLALAAHGRSQQYLETSFQMQHRSTSNDFNYPRAGHLTNMGQVLEDVHLPFTQHLAPAAHGRSLQFQETPFQMQQFSPSINFSHPRAVYSLNVERVLNDVQLPSTIAAINERFGMIDGHLNNPTEIFGRNMIDSSYIHAPRFHFRETAEMPGRTLNGDTYVLRELQRRNAILRSMQQARLMLDQG